MGGLGRSPPERAMRGERVSDRLQARVSDTTLQPNRAFRMKYQN